MVLDDTQLQDQQPEVVEQVETSQPDQQTVQQQAEAQQIVSQREMNMRKAWEKAERAERERDELARRLQAIESQKQTQPQDDDVVIGPDDIVDGKQFNKVYNRWKRESQELRESIAKAQQQNTQDLAEARLRAQYPDFDKVVSETNIQSLVESEPELAATLHTSPDYYRKALSTYKLIKKLGIHQEDLYAQDRQAVQRNAAKPKPLASLSPQQGASPLSQANIFANGLTPELKAQLWKETQQYSKG